LELAIEELGFHSIVWKFASGRWDDLPEGAVGSEVYVRKGWHQTPHFTVQLQFRMYGG